MASKLIIGTRGSRLALAQSHWVAVRLAAGGAEVVIREMATRGDREAGHIPTLGATGVFTREIEHALAAGRIDIAVHSLKDLPIEQPEGLTLGAIPPREAPEDALVVPEGAVAAALADLPPGARVGTSSVRRGAFLLHQRPGLNVLPLRGNVDTRIGKLDGGEYDAILLASAGLMRLGLGDRIACRLPRGQFPPAPAQGALAVQVRADDPAARQAVALLHDADTASAVQAERGLLLRLGGGCQLPLGACCTRQGRGWRLDALLCSPGGEQAARAVARGDDPARLADDAYRQLLDGGAQGILDALPPAQG